MHANKTKPKNNTLKCRGSGGNGDFLGLCRGIGRISRVQKMPEPSLQPQETSVSSASSAFQGFVFGFGFIRVHSR
jgi:hypothetical protein